MRSGKRSTIHPEDIVVGDLVILKSGMEVQGDGILVEANMVESDESSMTGESEPQRKDIFRRCMIEMEREIDKQGLPNHQAVSSPVLLAGSTVR